MVQNYIDQMHSFVALSNYFLFALYSSSRSQSVTFAASHFYLFFKYSCKKLNGRTSFIYFKICVYAPHEAWRLENTGSQVKMSGASDKHLCNVMGGSQSFNFCHSVSMFQLQQAFEHRNYLVDANLPLDQILLRNKRLFLPFISLFHIVSTFRLSFSLV